MGREALCVQCLSVWNICTYIYFLHIYAIFTCYKTTELLGTRLRDDNYVGFFVFCSCFRSNTLENFSVLAIIWRICARLISLKCDLTIRGTTILKNLLWECIFLSKIKYFREQNIVIIQFQCSKPNCWVNWNVIYETSCEEIIFFWKPITFSYTAF